MTTISLGTGGTTNPLLRTLEAQGLSATKAGLVGKDLEASLTQVSGSISSGKPDVAAVRDVLDKRIADDVSSGALSQEDAAKINKTLDTMQADASGGTDTDAAAPVTSQAKGSGAHGGGSGGAASKTEASRTVTVAGGMKTTTITYTDGSTETTTAIASSADDAKAAEAHPSAVEANATNAYAPQIAPGSLVDETG